MKTVRMILALAVVLLIAAAPLAAKERGEKKAPPCPAAAVVDRIVKDLTLTAEQTTKLDELKKEYGPKLMEAAKKGDVLTPEQKKAAADARAAAKAAGKKGKDAAADIDAATKITDEQKAKIADCRKECGALSKELGEKVKAVLTAEQKEQIKKAHDEKKKK